MLNLNSRYSVWLKVLLLVLVLATHTNGQKRWYPNPLNKQKIDLYFVVDQRPQYMSKTDFVFLKSSIGDIAAGLNPSGSDPCFGSYFYGPTNVVSSPFGFCTKTAVGVRSNLDLLVYPVSASNPTTLTDALVAVSSSCSSSCRSDVPRVTLIISSNLDASAASVIRQIERNIGMMFFAVAVGTNSNNAATAELLASYPQKDHAVPVPSYSNFNIFADYLKSVISDVPRPFPIQSFVSAGTVPNGIFHSMQINTAAITATNEAIIMLASNCARCNTYASLSELIPSDMNSPAFVGRQFYIGTGAYSYLSYFRVPRNTTRLFVSFKGDGSSSVFFTCDIVSLPGALTFPQIAYGSGLEAVMG